MNLNWTHKRTDMFSVHVSRVPVAVSEEGLKNLFQKAGDVKEIHISKDFPSTGKYTYAFVRFLTLDEARKACEVFNNTQLNGTNISVSISHATRDRFNTDSSTNRLVRNNGESIVRNQYPRLEPGLRTVSSSSKEREVHQILKASLNNINDHSDPMNKWLGIKCQKDCKEFMQDFSNVLLKMSNIPASIGSEVIKTKHQPVSLENIENCILRYHDTTVKSNNLFKDIDIDLSCEHLSVEDEQYFFNAINDDYDEVDEIAMKYLH